MSTDGFLQSANQICEAFTEQRKKMPRAQRTVRNEEDKTSFSLGRSAESIVIRFLSAQLAQPDGAVNAS